MKQRKQMPKERNQFVAASLFRKAGKHKLSARKLRRNEDKFGKIKNFIVEIFDLTMYNERILINFSRYVKNINTKIRK